jgi:glycosyltransferase involved in cell wall biosynthesis
LFKSLRHFEYKYENITIHKIGKLPLFWPILNNILFNAQIRKIFYENNIDIIFAESYTNETRIPKDLPFVYDLADDYAAPADIYGTKLYKTMFAVLRVKKSMEIQCKHSIAVTCVSKMLFDTASKYSKNVNLLPNGVEDDIIRDIRKNNKPLKSSPYSIIYASGFGVWSRPIELLNAAKKLKREFPELKLTMVGDGTEGLNIKEFIKTNKAAQYIKFLGFQNDRKKVLTLISEHSIGINICDKNKWRDAAHPMKVMDYSAFGKIVVSTKLRGVQDLNYRNIYITPSDSYVSLVHTLRKAINDSARNLPFEEVKDDVLNNYSWTKLITELEDIFNRSLKLHNSKNIIHVTPSYIPVLGGLENVVNSLATEQIDLGKKVKIITSAPSGLKLPLNDTLEVERLKSFVFANTNIMPQLPIAISKLNKDKDFVHLHVTQAYTPDIVWLLSKIKKFEYIAHIHLDVPQSGKFGFLLSFYKKLILRNVLKSASSVVVFTEDQRNFYAKRYNLDLNKIEVIPNGVGSEYFSGEEKSLHRKPRLLYVGRLNYQKNLTLLLMVLAQLPNVSADIVGDGEEFKKLNDLSNQLKLKNITFKGRVDKKDLPKLYNESDIFVLTSVREGMPLVLLEAMASGLPCVVTDVPGSRDLIINNKNGFVVKPNSELDFRLAILKIINDRELYNSFSVSSKQIAAKHQWHNIATKFNKLYEA